MERYDAIVVGAGPAGGQFARELSAKGHSVLLLERSKVIGEPNFSSGGTLKETFDTFSLPLSVAQREWDGLVLISKNERSLVGFKAPRGYVLDYKRLKQFLAKEAEGNGAKVVTGAAVTGPIIKDGKVVGVRFNGLEAYSEIVIDSSGPSSVVGSKVGIVDEKGAPAIGIEYLLSGVNLEHSKSLYFYIGSAYAPLGYAWIFPTGEHEAKVGIAWDGAKRDESKKLLDKMIRESSELKGSKVLDFHGGYEYYLEPKSFVKGNVMVLGDAAGQCNPLGYEGIRHAMHAGRFAAGVCDRYLNSKSRDLKALREYDKLWKRYIGSRWSFSMLIHKHFYVDKNDNLSDRGVAFSRRISPEALIDILFNYRFASLGLYLGEILKTRR